MSARSPDNFGLAFSEISQRRAQALYLVDDSMFSTYRKTLVKLASTARLPTSNPIREFVDEGGLMSYAPNVPDMFRRSAEYVDKILKGAKPGDLPIEQPTKFEFVVNLKTARALGLKIPESVLLEAELIR